MHAESSAANVRLRGYDRLLLFSLVACANHRVAWTRSAGKPPDETLRTVESTLYTACRARNPAHCLTFKPNFSGTVVSFPSALRDLERIKRATTWQAVGSSALPQLSGGSQGGGHVDSVLERSCGLHSILVVFHAFHDFSRTIPIPPSPLRMQSCMR